MSREPSSLHTIIHELEDEAQIPSSLLNGRVATRKAELVELLGNLQVILKQIEDIAKHYLSLGRDQKHTWIGSNLQRRT